MTVINLNESTAADIMFMQITSMEPTQERSNMIRAFCNIFWAQLSEEHRNAYRKCYTSPECFDDPGDAERMAGEAAYNYGMAMQDRETIDY